jgi:hypothetical protein
MFQKCAIVILLQLVASSAAHSIESAKDASPGMKAGKSAPVTPSKKNAPAPPAAPANLQIPDGPALNILIRRTLLTINDANLSGNYSVLRDLAAPGFQGANSQATLVGIFADLRNRNVDLAPILMFDPKLVRQPEIDANGMLHVSGIVPTAPEQVNFELLFQSTAGRWRLFGVALNTSRSQALVPANANAQ